MLKIKNNTLKNWASFFAKRLGNLALGLSSLLIAMYFMVLFFQIVSRLIFGISFSWAEEIALYLNIWAVMLTGSVLIWKNELIRVDFFDSLWSSKFINIRDKVFNVLLVVILAILFWQGITQAIYGINSKLISVNMSMFWVYLAVPVGMILIP